MSEPTSSPSADDERAHTQDPAEGAAEDQGAEPDLQDAHTEDPAEGPDDETAQ